MFGAFFHPRPVGRQQPVAELTVRMPAAPSSALQVNAWLVAPPAERPDTTASTTTDSGSVDTSASSVVILRST